MALGAGFDVSRRGLLRAGTLGLAGIAAGEAFAEAAAPPAQPGVRPELFQRALAALDKHRNAVPRRDLIAIADFAAPSSNPRFHLVNTISGRSTSLLVSHGRGSDPAHTGWLSRFSNEDGSLATSSGAYLTGDTYYGKHGRSRRLTGLDATNSLAETRGIVVHAASRPRWCASMASSAAARAASRCPTPIWIRCSRAWARAG